MTQYKKNADGTLALDKNGNRIASISHEQQRVVFNERLLDYYKRGFECLEVLGEGFNAAKIYRIMRAKDGYIYGMQLKHFGINVYGEEYHHTMEFRNKQSLKRLHKMLGEVLDKLEEEDHKLK